MPSLVPVTQSPHPPTLSPPTTLCLFPRVRNLLWFVFLSNSFPLSFPPFPYNPCHYILYATYEWNHMTIVLWLTYFTFHNTLHFHLHQSKWWVFILSDGWVIFHCVYRQIFFIHSSFDGNHGSIHSLAIVDTPAKNFGVQVSRRFIASGSLG